MFIYIVVKGMKVNPISFPPSEAESDHLCLTFIQENCYVSGIPLSPEGSEADVK